MERTTVDNPGCEPQQRQVYSIGYGPCVHLWHSERTAASRAAFLLPHLRAGHELT